MVLGATTGQPGAIPVALVIDLVERGIDAYSYTGTNGCNGHKVPEPQTWDGLPGQNRQPLAGLQQGHDLPNPSHRGARTQIVGSPSLLRGTVARPTDQRCRN